MMNESGELRRQMRIGFNARRRPINQRTSPAGLSKAEARMWVGERRREGSGVREAEGGHEDVTEKEAETARRQEGGYRKQRG